MPDTDHNDVLLLADLRRALGTCPTAQELSDDAHNPVPHAFELEPGSRLAGFEILSLIGHGGTSFVYRARDTNTDQFVAVKVLPMPGGETISTLFRREAEVAARLKHPHILPIVGSGTTSGCNYFVMPICSPIPEMREILQDSTFHEQLSASRYENAYKKLAASFADVGDAIAVAHASGIVHRDIKPQNILRDDLGRWQICDFGLASVGVGLTTATLSPMGTFSYASPEQVLERAQKITSQTDVYSLGATLYHVLSGSPPFVASSVDRLVRQIRLADPRLPRHCDRRIPVQLETICLRALQKNPRNRYGSMKAMAADLRLFSDGLPICGRPISATQRLSGKIRYRRVLVSGTVAVALVIGLASLLIGHRASAIQADADRIVASVFDRLAYYDYRRPDLVMENFASAEIHATVGPRLYLTRALLHLGESDELNAISALEYALDQWPTENPTAWYLLAWAHARNQDLFEFEKAWTTAESCSVPRSGADWFFRGLAIHFQDSGAALESYRRANKLRTEKNEFFPQALLHLARAHNQTLYHSRSQKSFRAARECLSEIIKSANYGAYPYYLLSTAYRLASVGAHGFEPEPGLVSSHDYINEALRWSRVGQDVDPNDSLIITAEAEALEANGRYQEAIEARTNAIATTENRRAHCEAFHYRWRLHFWVGNLDHALQDIQSHAQCMPDNWSYQYIYPAMVHFAAGRTKEAVDFAMRLSRDQDTGFQATIWTATCLRIIGRPVEAENHLLSRAEELAQREDSSEDFVWNQALYDICLGTRMISEIANDSRWSRSELAEAYFHDGVRQWALGAIDNALNSFDYAHRCYDGELGYSYHARLLLELATGDGISTFDATGD